jgi:hypothetical protein
VERGQNVETHLSETVGLGGRCVLVHRIFVFYYWKGVIFNWINCKIVPWKVITVNAANVLQHFQVIFKVIRIITHFYNKPYSEYKSLWKKLDILWHESDLCHFCTHIFNILRCHIRNSPEVNFPTYSFPTLISLPMSRCLAQPSDVNYRHYGSIPLLHITLPRTSTHWRTLLFREVPSVPNYVDIQLIPTDGLLNDLKLLINRVL